jgi:hypothetical protein
MIFWYKKLNKIVDIPKSLKNKTVSDNPLPYFICATTTSYLTDFFVYLSKSLYHVCVELAEELKVGLNQNKIYAAAVDDDGE